MGDARRPSIAGTAGGLGGLSSDALGGGGSFSGSSGGGDGDGDGAYCQKPMPAQLRQGSPSPHQLQQQQQPQNHHHPHSQQHPLSHPPLNGTHPTNPHNFQQWPGQYPGEDSGGPLAATVVPGSETAYETARHPLQRSISVSRIPGSSLSAASTAAATVVSATSSQQPSPLPAPALADAFGRAPNSMSAGSLYQPQPPHLQHLHHHPPSMQPQHAFITNSAGVGGVGGGSIPQLHMAPPAAAAAAAPPPTPGAWSRLRSTSLTSSSAPLSPAPVSPSPGRAAGARRISGTTLGASSARTSFTGAPYGSKPGSIAPGTAVRSTATVYFACLNGAFEGTRVVTLEPSTPAAGVLHPYPMGRPPNPAATGAGGEVGGTAATVASGAAGAVDPYPVLRFSTKVVSRNHAVLWYENGRILIQDTKSSSGTFVNGRRLSPQGQESAKVELRDGDVVQLGEDCVLNGVMHKCIVVKVSFEAVGPPMSASFFSTRSNPQISYLGEGDTDEFIDYLSHPNVRYEVEAEVASIWAFIAAGDSSFAHPLARMHAIERELAAAAAGGPTAATPPPPPPGAAVFARRGSVPVLSHATPTPPPLSPSTQDARFRSGGRQPSPGGGAAVAVVGGGIGARGGGGDAGGKILDHGVRERLAEGKASPPASLREPRTAGGPEM